VARAQAGDGEALEAVIAGIEDRVYALALRMVGVRADAEDAAQEVLIRIARSIGSFRGDAKFTTWVYQVAANYFLTARKRGAELRERTLDHMAQWIDAGVAGGYPPEADPVIVEEGRLICIQAMLSCLDRDHRIAYILGEVIEVSADEGGAILGISAEAFRQRLSRARKDLERFFEGRCGLIEQAKPSCTCDRQAGHGLATGLIDPARLKLANHPARTQLAQIGAVRTAAELFRSVPEWRAPRAFAKQIRPLVTELE
jgi:RNA polymerase sigma factor (sigma-70 family)